MSDSLYAGEWFLPGSFHRLPGRLIFNDQKKIIELELIGTKFLDGQPVVKVGSERDKRYHSTNYNDGFSGFHLLVLGMTRGTHITLYSCTIAGVSDVGKDIYSIKYHAVFAFFGAHIPSKESFLIKSSTFMFPFLCSWYDGWKSVDKLSIFEEREFSISDQVGPKDDGSPLRINENLSVHIYDRFTKGMRDVGVHHDLKHEKYIQFLYDRPMHFTSMRKDASTFLHMLEFSLGSPLNSRLTEIVLPAENVSSDNTHPFEIGQVSLPVGNFTLLKGKDDIKHTQHQNYMLVSRWNMEVSNLNDFIKQWYAKESDYSFFDFYLDSNNWPENSNEPLSNVMFNNRFLNIVQGLEAYHRNYLAGADPSRDVFDMNKKRILAMIHDPQLKQWLNNNFKFKKHWSIQDKIQAVIASVGDIISPIFGRNQIVDFFPTFSAVTRNNLSHAAQDKTFQGKALIPFFKFGQILLAICILKTLGVPDIIDKILHYDKFARDIEELRVSGLRFE